MGNNAAFTAFEASVLAVYNSGKLDKDLLDSLAEPYSGMDIDRGGQHGTLSKDGLDIDGIILKMYGVNLPPAPKLPENYKDWTPEQNDANDEWWEIHYDALRPIEEAWGWR